MTAPDNTLADLFLSNDERARLLAICQLLAAAADDFRVLHLGAFALMAKLAGTKAAADLLPLQRLAADRADVLEVYRERIAGELEKLNAAADAAARELSEGTPLVH